jgi:hypothetical protein
VPFYAVISIFSEIFGFLKRPYLIILSSKKKRLMGFMALVLFQGLGVSQLDLGGIPVLRRPPYYYVYR